MRVKLSSFVFLLSLCTLAAETLAKSDDVEMKIKDEQILLTSSGCDLLIPAQKGLNQFYYKKTKIEQELSKCECSPKVDGHKKTCKVNVTSQLSEEIVSQLKTTPPNDGPNCFNTSLQAVGILPYSHFSDGAFFWLNGPLCEEINASDRRPGDIVSLEQDLIPIHSFIYINDNILYHKENYTSESTPKLDSVARLMDTLSVNENCSWKNSKNCNKELNSRFFRCMTWEDYQSKFPRTTVQKEIQKQINVFSCEVSQFTFTNQVIEIQHLDNLSYHIKILQVMAKENARQEYNEVLEISSTDSIDINDPRVYNYIFWEAIYHRSESIMEQIRLLRP